MTNLLAAFAASVGRHYHADINRSRIGMTECSCNDAKQLNEKDFSLLTSHFSHKRAAFTLAEVLITLGIIGIVAALTIPNIVQNYKKKITVEKLKTAYSIFSQAVKLSVNENGPISDWQYDDNIELGNRYLIPYLKGLQKADKYSPMRTLSAGENIDGGAANTSYLTWPRHVGAMSYVTPIYLIPNGMLFVVTEANLPRFDDAHIIVDINGYKGPNIMGIDGFRFSLDKKSSTLKPTDRAIANDCVRDDQWPYYRGGNCAGKIAKDGWQITDDYPWGNGGLTTK